MISLKKYIRGDPETETALGHVVGILLQGMGLHAVESTPSEHGRFRQSLDEIAGKFHAGLPAAESMVQATLAIKLLEDYNRRTADFLQMPGAEFRSMARMLASAIGAMAATGKDNLEKLHAVEETMVSVSLLEDVRLVKMQLAACLEAIRTEKERQRTETQKTVEGLTKELERAQNESQADRADPVTGLGPRKEAEAAILKACREPARHFVAVFSMDRVENINLRYGYEVGDNVLRQYTQFLRGRLPKADALFRWTGVTLVAVLGRPQRAEIVRDEVGRIMSVPLEHTVKTATRSVLLTVAARWALFNCLPEPQPLLASIDNFARTRTASD